MKNINIIYLFLLNFSAVASDNHHTSFFDLKFYIINFLIFLTIFVWKILPIAKNHFREQHLLMKNQFHTASEKLRLAKVEKEAIEKDLAGLERKISDMKNSSERDLDVYKIRYKKELEDKVSTLAKDLDYQLEFEAMALNNNMYKNLISTIVDKVERKVKDSSSDTSELAKALIRKAGIN